MFADDPKMRVTQEASGVIRMLETDVPTDLLNIRISHLSFKPEVLGYRIDNPRWVPSVILAAPEVRSFMRAHRIVFPSGLPLEPMLMPGSTVLSGDLEDVTVAHALDSVLGTFPGLWIYENCASEDKTNARMVFFKFFPNSPGWAYH
jgi:hypothetical protein